MKIDKTVKTRFQMFVLIFLVSIAAMVITTPIHEACHWVLSDIDPYIQPTEFHAIDGNSLQKGQDILPSSLGYVVVKESYPGAFRDRPPWADAFQEIICLCIQITLTCIIVLKAVKLSTIKYPKFFLFTQIKPSI